MVQWSLLLIFKGTTLVLVVGICTMTTIYSLANVSPPGGIADKSRYLSVLEMAWFSSLVIVPNLTWALGLSPTLDVIAKNIKEEIVGKKLVQVSM